MTFNSNLGWAMGLQEWLPATAAAYETESEAIFAAFTTPPDTTRKGVIDTFVKALKTAGIWSKLDVLYVFAAADSQAARINWKNPGTFTATAVNSPTFTTDRGFTGNGSSSYVSSGFTPSTAGGQITQNSAHVSARALNNLSAASYRLIGTASGVSSNAKINVVPRNTGDVFFARMNSDNLSVTPSNSNSIAHWIVSRSASTSTQFYKDGSALGANNTIASGGLCNVAVTFVGDPAAANYAAFQVASGSIGSSLNGTEAAALAAAELAYMQAVGAA